MADNTRTRTRNSRQQGSRQNYNDSYSDVPQRSSNQNLRGHDAPRSNSRRVRAESFDDYDVTGGGFATNKKKLIIKDEVNVKVEEIRTEKKEKKIKAKLIPEKPAVVLKVGDRVRMKDGKAIGTIEKIEKNKVSVNYGVFISKTNLESLEYVQPS